MADSGSLLNLAMEQVMTYAMTGTEGVALSGISKGLAAIEKKTNFDLGSEYYGPLGSVRYYNDIYEEIKATNQQLGISSNMAGQIEKNFDSVLPKIIRMGGSMGDMAKEYKSFVEYTSRNRFFTGEQISSITEMTLALGDSYAKIFAENAKAGVTIEQTRKELEQMAVSSNEIGVSFKESSKTFLNNIEKSSMYNFNDGRIGLMKMAEYAESTKISVQTALGFTDKLLDGGIQGAINMSAQMQVLGGEISQFGDAYQLYFDALNNPEQLQRGLGEAVSQMMTFNEELGEMEFASSGAMLRAREMSKITGASFKELADAGKIIGKEKAIENLFSFPVKSQDNFDKILTKVAGVTEYSKELGTWVTSVGDMQKTISELSMNDIAELDTLDVNDPDGYFKKLISVNESIEQHAERTSAALRNITIGDDLYRSVKELLVEFDSSYDNNTLFGDDTLLGQGIKFMQGLYKGAADNFDGRINFLKENKDYIQKAFKFIEDTATTVYETIVWAWEGLQPLLEKLVNGIFSLVKIMESIGKNLGVIERTRADREEAVTSDFSSEIIDKYKETGSKRLYGGVALGKAYEQRFENYRNAYSEFIDKDPSLEAQLPYDTGFFDSNEDFNMFEDATNITSSDAPYELAYYDREIINAINSGKSKLEAENKLEDEITQKYLSEGMSEENAKIQAEIYFERLKPFLIAYENESRPVFRYGSELYKMQEEVLRAQYNQKNPITGEIKGEINLTMGEYSKLISSQAEKDLFEKFIKYVQSGFGGGMPSQ